MGVIKNERGEASIENPDETVREPSHLDFKCLNHMPIFSAADDTRLDVYKHLLLQDNVSFRCS